MRILAISGSLRADSYNTALARAAVERAPEDAEIELYDRLGEIPPYDADADIGADAGAGIDESDDGFETGESSEDGVPEPVVDLRRRIAEADALLVVTPEYNGSVPGVLKNAIDWASRPPTGGAALWGKTVAVAGATTGQYGAIWAQQDLRKILGIAGARVIEGELPVARAPSVFDESGRLSDPLLGERLRRHLENLAHEASVVALAA